MDTDAEPSAFPRTSAKLRAALHDPASRDAVMEMLAERYWKPVYHFARRAWAKSGEDAKDHTQGFFAWLLERDLFAKYDPSSCSFGTYLKSLLRNFAGNEHQALRRLKRGGGLRFVPIDDEPAADSTPEDAFDRAWRADVVARAIARVKEHYASRRRPVPFLVFEASLAESSYPALASRFGVKKGDVRNYLHEVRDRVRVEVRIELEATGERSDLADGLIGE